VASDYISNGSKETVAVEQKCSEHPALDEKVPNGPSQVAIPQTKTLKNK
jgi:hypothetical protein